METRILFDNDVLLKLARYRLLDQAIALFDCDPSNIYVLATAKYALLPANDRLRRCEDEESAARLEAFFRSSQSLNANLVDLELLDALNAIQNIDAGESLLFAMGASHSDTLVVTGDKRALAALCAHDSISHISNALAGRIVCIEVLFLYLIENYFADVQMCIRSKPTVDKTLSIVFGVSAPADYPSVRAGLVSYIRHLRAVTGTLLYEPDS